MSLFKFFVIILPVMIEEGKMRCPESFPQRLRNRLSNYVSIRTPSVLSWIVSVIKSSDGVEINYPAADLPPNPSGHGVSGCRVSEFKKVMTSSDITGKQTIGIPAWFVNQNRSWFNSRHDDCSVFAAGEENKKCRISWHHREGGWKFAFKKLKPSVGDTVEFNLVFDNASEIHTFYISILETGIANGMGKLEIGSSSRSKRRV
ncbi:hypothetical protein ACFE04_030580 [Oxalis oulophora]